MIENKIEILKKYIKIYKPLSIIRNFTEDKIINTIMKLK